MDAWKRCPHCEMRFALQSTLNRHLDERHAGTSRVETLEAAMRRAIRIIDDNLYHQREKVEDASAILREALEPN